MAIRTVGTGKAYASLAACFAALVNGDTIETYGPYAENNQTLAPPAGIINITWRHYGDDYVFDGTAATAVWLTFAASNTGWNINMRSSVGGRIKVTRYIGTQPFVLGGANTILFGPWLTANGAAGIYQNTMVLNANFVSVGDVLIDYPFNAVGINWIGLYLLSGMGLSVRDVTIENVAKTGAGSTFALISSTSALVASPLIQGLVVRNIACGAAFYGAYLPGVNGFVTLLDAKVYAINAGGTIIGVYVGNRSCRIVNLLTHGFVSATTRKGLVLDGSQVDAGIPNSSIYNCTLIDGTHGIDVLVAPIGGQRFVQNCIAHNASTSEFSTVAGGVAGSMGNWATMNRYSANWPVSATDLSGSPIFVDELNNDYRLRWQPGVESPCVDSGVVIPSRTMDVDGQPISGNGMDRGCFEFQQVGSRYERGSRTGRTVIVPSRNSRQQR